MCPHTTTLRSTERRQEDLVPHSHTLLLFTTSAQTHIFPEIRIDAIRFLDILLEAIPQPVAKGWTNGSTHGGRGLLGYLGILNAGVVFDQGTGTTHFLQCEF